MGVAESEGGIILTYRIQELTDDRKLVTRSTDWKLGSRAVLEILIATIEHENKRQGYHQKQIQVISDGEDYTFDRRDKLLYFVDQQKARGE